MAEKPFKTINLNDPNNGPITLWVGHADMLSRIPGRLDKAIVLLHDMGAPMASWRLACIPESNDNVQFFKAVIELMQQYCDATENAPKKDTEPKKKLETDPPPTSTAAPKRHVIPLPDGTTKEQAEGLANQIRAAAGLKVQRPE